MTSAIFMLKRFVAVMCTALIMQLALMSHASAREPDGNSGCHEMVSGAAAPAADMQDNPSDSKSRSMDLQRTCQIAWSVVPVCDGVSIRHSPELTVFSVLSVWPSPMAHEPPQDQRPPIA